VFGFTRLDAMTSQDRSARDPKGKMGRILRGELYVLAGCSDRIGMAVYL